MAISSELITKSSYHQTLVTIFDGNFSHHDQTENISLKSPFLMQQQEIYNEKSSFRQDRRSFALGSEQDEFRFLSKKCSALIACT